MLNGVKSTEARAQPPSNSPTLLSLPPEMIKTVLSSLPASDLTTLTTVSRSLHYHVITDTPYSTIESTKQFIEDLISSLEEKSAKKLNGRTYLWQVNILKNILRDALPVKIKKLPELKKHVLLLKHRLTDVLKTIDPEKTVALRGIRLPRFFENIFDLAAENRGAYLKMAESYDDPNFDLENISFSFNFDTVSLNLLTFYGVERTLEIVKSYSRGDNRDSILYCIIRYLMDVEEVDKATEAMELMSEGHSQSAGLKHISDRLAKVFEFDRAIHLAASKTPAIDASLAYVGISLSLARAGLNDRACEVVLLIPNPRTLSIALTNIFLYLVEDGGLDKALFFVLSLSDRKARRDVFSSVFAHPKSELQFVVNRIRDSLEGVSNKFTEDQIIDIIVSLPDKNMMVSFFADIFLAFIKAGNRQKALETLELIDSQRLKFDILVLASEDLCRAGELDSAIEIAQIIRYDYRGSNILKTISEMYATAGQPDKAIQAAEMIPDPYEKARIVFRGMQS